MTPPPLVPFRARLARGLALSLAVLLALALAFEVAVAVGRLPGLRPHELDPISDELSKARIQPHPYLAYANRPNFRLVPTADDPLDIQHNSLGFRGAETTWEKHEGVFRIVCLGGSSTYGFGPTSDATNWPTRLQGLLNQAPLTRRVEVINLAAQGYSTFESLIQLALRGVSLEPDLVLVYHAINDMRCALYPGVVRDNSHWRAVWPVERPSKSEQLLERSGIYRTWRRYATDWVMERENMGAYLIVDFGRWWPDDFGQPTDLDLGFQNFERNLVTIIATARAHGSEVMLVTQGTRMSDFDDMGSAQLQRDGFDRANRILAEVSEAHGTYFCDARAVLEAEADRQRALRGEDDVFTSTVHMTDAGCELLARTLAARILELGIVP